MRSPVCVSGRSMPVCRRNQKFEKRLAKVFPRGMFSWSNGRLPTIRAAGLRREAATRAGMSSG